MYNHCENCGRDKVEVHKVAYADDTGIGSMYVCDACDDYSQGVISEKDWREITGQEEEPYED